MICPGSSPSSLRRCEFHDGAAVWEVADFPSHYGQTDAKLSIDSKLFYNRFNVHDFSEDLEVLRNTVFNDHGVVKEQTGSNCTGLRQDSVEVNRYKVVKPFRSTKERKSSGPELEDEY